MDEKYLKKLGAEILKRKKSEYDEYPDCYEISASFKEELINKKNFPKEKICIREYIVDNGFRHYVVEVRINSTWKVVDCSFSQFDSNTNTPINLGNDLEEVIVVDRQRYILNNKNI